MIVELFGWICINTLTHPAQSKSHFKNGFIKVVGHNINFIAIVSLSLSGFLLSLLSFLFFSSEREEEEKNRSATRLCLSFYLSISYANWLNDSKCDKNYPLVAGARATGTEISKEEKKRKQIKQTASRRHLTTVIMDFYFDIVRFFFFVGCCVIGHHKFKNNYAFSEHSKAQRWFGVIFLLCFCFHLISISFEA